MTIHVNRDGPLAGLLTKPSEVNAADHPNRTRYYNGNLPPEDLIYPHGAMMVVQVMHNAEGSTTGGKVLLPDNAKDAWITPKFVVAAVGPDVKWVERGDVVLVLPNIAQRLEVDLVRIDGWEVMLIHEGQTQGRAPKLRVLPEPRKLDQKPVAGAVVK